jgi:hypothetical protein
MTSGFLPRRFGHDPADSATLEKRDNCTPGATWNDSSEQSVGLRIAESDALRVGSRVQRAPRLDKRRWIEHENIGPDLR